MKNLLIILLLSIPLWAKSQIIADVSFDVIRAADFQIKTGYQLKSFNLGVEYENFYKDDFNQFKVYSEYYFKYSDTKDFIIGTGIDLGYDFKYFGQGFYMIERCYPQAWWHTNFGFTLTQKVCHYLDKYYFENRIGIFYKF